MDKSGGNAAKEYLTTLDENEPVFYSSIVEAGRKAMKENVKAAMQLFAKMK